jgi:hypothetical protein
MDLSRVRVSAVNVQRRFDRLKTILQIALLERGNRTVRSMARTNEHCLPDTSISHSYSTIRTCVEQDFERFAGRLDPEEKR